MESLHATTVQCGTYGGFMMDFAVELLHATAHEDI